MTFLADQTSLLRTDIEKAVWSAPAPGAPVGDDSPRPPGRLRRAAVLCPIILRPQGLTVALTVRAAHLNAHAGQISFPGGKIDVEDPSPMATALREAEEEIGLAPRYVEIAGALDPYVTSTGYHVTPFVGFVDPRFTPRLSPGEVAEFFEAPLDFLMNVANHQRRAADRGGVTRHYYAIPYGERFIWGATAGMLRGLALRLSRVRRGERHPGFTKYTGEIPTVTL